MCVLAAYHGDASAAPELLEMLERTEGCAGAYYSGIATIDQRGKLHHLKTIGAVSDLRKMGAAELPGKIGIAHGRPHLGGGREWAHPFVSECGQAAFAVNGHTGFFDNPERDANDLEAFERDGVRFLSRDKDSLPEHRPDPSVAVHNSELGCRYVEHLHRNGASWFEAVLRKCSERPSETAGLLLTTDAEHPLSAYRVSQPLFLGRTLSATYLSTTTIAFPEANSIWQAPLPAPSAIQIQRDTYTVQPLWVGNEVPVHQQLPWLKAEQLIRGHFADGNHPCIQDLKDLTAHLWASDKAPQKDFLVYSIVQQMLANGELKPYTTDRPGAAPSLNAPETRFKPTTAIIANF